MANATTIWGAQDGNDGLGTDCTNTASTTPLTCNGNGNGIVRESGTGYESFRFWQHLSNAGMIEGRYNGIIDSGSSLDATPGFNVPAGKINNSGYSIYYIYTVGDTFSTVTMGSHLMMFGAERVGNTSGPLLTPLAQMNLDAKIDDGTPGNGKMLSQPSTSPTTPNCATTDDPATAVYNVTNNNPLCSIQYKLGF